MICFVFYLHLNPNIFPYANYRKPNPCCPIDNQPLTTNDLFPDNYTRREIKQIRRHCPHADLGCAVVLSPLDVDAHLAECSFAKANQVRQQPECPFSTCGCTFYSADAGQMNSHLHADMAVHLNVSDLVNNLGVSRLNN